MPLLREGVSPFPSSTLDLEFVGRVRARASVSAPLPEDLFPASPGGALRGTKLIFCHDLATMLLQGIGPGEFSVPRVRSIVRERAGICLG